MKNNSVSSIIITKKEGVPQHDEIILGDTLSIKSYLVSNHQFSFFTSK